ncbi:MAG TPA: hypothetical protein VL285_10095 [Bryobacteraceae bacterium]|jgi:hypothetical protein|nr:hypothetical protein [Bryobacteraceae bacterium]
MSFTKSIRSRSNKNIGDTIEENWEILAKTVIAEPQAGNPSRGVPPRFGIYEYEVKPLPQQIAPKPVAARRKQSEPSVGGTRREASSVALTVRRRT